MTLPPGQHAVKGFPRFGTHLAKPAPAIPRDPVIEISGAVSKPMTIPLADLAKLPRRELDADFHCVAGWSATGLHWEGVALATFYREVIEPSIPAQTTVTHLRFGGWDDYWSLVTIADALAEDVLIAEHLDGHPLDSDHGAPARLVSPSQYGYISTKHLNRIEVLTAEPEDAYGSASTLSNLGLRLLGFNRHSRSRVWEEERQGALPNWLALPIYRLITPSIAFLSARSDSRGEEK